MCVCAHNLFRSPPPQKINEKLIPPPPPPGTMSCFLLLFFLRYIGTSGKIGFRSIGPSVTKAVPVLSDFIKKRGVKFCQSTVVITVLFLHARNFGSTKPFPLWGIYMSGAVKMDNGITQRLVALVAVNLEARILFTFSDVSIGDLKIHNVATFLRSVIRILWKTKKRVKVW